MKVKNKQVDTIKYDKNYFGSLFKSPDYSKRVKFDSFGHIYRHLAEMAPLSPNETVVDFGCGNGELSFCLYHKYQVNVVGIDYSADAIQIAIENLNKLKINDKKAKINFINVNNNKLPDLKNINYVFFCDVLEHMYEPEIKLVLNTIKKWNIKKIRIVVHTDNNYFLRFIRPVLDFFSIITGTYTISEIKKRNLWESERHVNLTNPDIFRESLSKYGFRELKMSYPKPNKDNIDRQLAGLSKIPFANKFVHFLLRIFTHLSPSFYGVYEYKAS